MIFHKIAPTMALLCFSVGVAFAATPDQIADQPGATEVQNQFWTISGGEFKLRFNLDLLELNGIEVEAPAPASGQIPQEAQFFVLNVQQTDGLRFSADRGGFDRFVGGLIKIDEGFSFRLPDDSVLAYDGFQLRANQTNPTRLDVVGSDGRAWLYVNHLMYKLVDDYTGLYVRSADLRVSRMLADRLGVAELADAYIGEIKMRAHVSNRPADYQVYDIEGEPACPTFHGDPFPGGGIYEADVLMENYSMSFMRCRRSDQVTNGCDGIGPDDGEIVFAPSSTLRNSNKANTADVPWYDKFTLSPYNYPYPGNDQHPYLIWNVYRIVDDQLEQVGASGVKHAFTTTNGGCSDSCRHPHLLGSNCGDTYGTGNNDNSQDLGPRSELIPATGYWGRCGSIFDTNCDGSENNTGQGTYGSRLLIKESQLLVPNAQFYSDSWYVIQDDVDIYNTMAHRSMVPAPGGSGWTPGTQGAMASGPLINAWVNPSSNPTRNIEIASEEGRTRIAVKVKTLSECPVDSGLSGTCYRYDYAVHNFDFARVETEGNPPNLRVLDNRGFDSFTIPLDADAVYFDTGTHFADIDTNAGNNWTAAVGDGEVTWTAPAGNELNWGLLFRFTLISNAAPDSERTGTVRLGVAGAGEPSEFSGDMMIPTDQPQEPDDVIFIDGFEEPV